MATNGGRINFQVGYNVDQASLKKVTQSLRQLQNIKIGDFKGSENQLIEIQQTAKQVEIALTKAFNPSLNTVNIEKFNGFLRETDRTLDTIYEDFSKAGAAGRNAFGEMTSRIISTNTKLTQTKTLLNSMGQTMLNTVKWGIASSVMNTFTNSVRQAFDYVKGLDTALTNIRIVTGDSTEQMKQFAVEANNAAQSLGRSTMDYTKAALTFYQQGLDEEAVRARTESVLTAQNITGAGEEMADYLTAVWNGYKVANEEAELYVDKLAAVADSSASNMSELAVAMSKVASTANMLGVPVDSLNAQIATITATTRQAPETVGNALKTIYARINDIKTGADDAEVSLGAYTGAMAKLGVSVLDSNGQLRDTGDVIEQIGGKWQTLSREQQIYLARTMAGQRQYNNLLALFENWGKYSDLVAVSMDASGAAAEKNSRYMESLGAKIEQLGAAGERVKSALIDEDDLKGLVEFGTGTINLFANLIEGLGGGKNALIAFGSVLTSVFSGIIGREIGNFINKTRQAKASIEAMRLSAQSTKGMVGNQAYANDPVYKQYIDNMKQMQTVWSVMSKEQIKAQETRYNSIRRLKEQATEFEETAKSGQKLVDVLSGGKVDLSKNDLTRGLKEQLDEIEVLADTAAAEIEDLLSPDLSEEQVTKVFEKIKQSLNELQQTTEIDFSEEVQNILENGLGDDVQNEVSILLGYIKEIKQAKVGAETFKPLQQSARQAKDEAKGLVDQANKAHQNAKTIWESQGIVKFTSGLGRVATGINSIINLTKTWANENLSAGEKILQTFTTLSFIIPSVATGIKDLVKNAPAMKNMITSFGTLIASKLGLASASTAQAVAEAGSTGARIASDAAGKALTITNLGLAASFGVIALAAAPFIALGVAIYAMVKAWNKQADAAQKAAQVAKETKQTYEDLKTAYDDLKSSLEDYNSAQQAIKQMTKGTQEWRDAIRESNDAVLELIDNYPQLAEYVKNVNGQLVLSQQGQEAALQAAQERVLNARTASVETSRDSRVASARATAASIGHEISASMYLRGMGDLPTEAIMTVADKVADLDRTLGETNATGEDINKIIAEQTGLSESLVAEIRGQNGFSELINSLRENASATKLAYESMASEVLQDDATYKGLDNLGKQVADAIAGSNLDAAVAEKQAAYLDKLTGEGISRFSGASNQIVQKMLADLAKAGFDYQLSSNGVQGTDTNRTFEFIDAQGNIIKKSAEQVAAIIAANEALNSLGASAQKAASFLRDIEKLSDQTSSALKSFITGNGFGDLTRSQIQALNPDSQEMQHIFEEYAEEAGYKTAKEFKDAFIATQQSSLAQFRNILKGHSEAVVSSFNKIDTSKLTLNLQKQLIDNLQKAFNEGGREGAEQLASFYDNITDLKVLNELSNELDFTNISTEELKTALQNAGIATNLTTEQLEAYINAQKQAAEVISPEETYKNIHDIIDGLKSGDIIDAEQASKLEQAGISLDRFFVHMADGSLKLKGDAQDFYDYANNQSLEGFKNAINQLSSKVGQQIRFNEQSGYSASNYTSDTIDQGWQNFSNLAWEGWSANNQLLSEQINFLTAINNLSEEQKQIVQEVKDVRLEGNQINAQQARQISNILQQHRGDWENLESQIEGNIQQLNIYHQELENTIDAIKQLDPDVNEEQWENLSNYLHEYADEIEGVDDHLLEHREAAEEVAQSILRYNAALGEVIQKYDDWQAALTEGSLQQQIQAGNELQNIYSDLLDLPFESLSPDFTQSIDNLHLLQQAANGSEQAYNRLMQLAQQDIIAQIDIANLDNFYNQLNNVQGLMDQINFQDIEIGANLDTGNFLASLTDMVNAAGMTAQQATDYLASMGVDAVVKENTATATETQEQIGYKPIQSGEFERVQDVAYIGPDGKIHQGQVRYYATGVSYEPVTIPATSTKESKAFSLQVKSAHKSSGGGFKFQKSSNGGGSKGKTARAPKSGGGSKGGGGSKAKAPSIEKIQKASKPTQNIKAQRDPYHDINLALKKQEDLLDDIQKKDKKLVNRDRLKNLQEQNKALEKQQNLLSEKSSIAAGELVQLRNELLKDLGNGIKFDANGEISNYNQALQNAANGYNKAIDAYNRQISDAENSYNNWITNVYNTASAERQETLKQEKDRRKEQMDAAKEAAKVVLDNAKKEYDSIQNNIKEYEKTLELQRDIAENIEEISEQIYENLIAISKIKVDLAIDTGEAERDWLEFEKKFIKKLGDDDFLGQAKAGIKDLMSYFNSEQVQKTATQIANIRKEISIMEKGGISSIYGNNLAQAKEDLEQYMKQQMDDLGNIQDIVDDIKDTYLDAINDANDKMEEQVKQYERVNDLIEHNVKLTELLYGDKAYNTINKYYNLQMQNNQKELQSLKNQQDYWRERMSQEVVGSDAWKKFKDNLDKVTDDLNSKLEDMIQNLADQWENRVDGIIEKLNNALTNGRGLDYLNEQWDYINNFDDNFLDTVNAQFGIQQVTNLYNEAINGLMGNPTQQQKINKLMNDQLKILREKDKLTEYDVERAKAVLQVEQARMALEDARNAKTKMRLRRDSQGNYTYQYVADEEKLGELQQALADAQNNLYNQDKEHYKQNLNSLYDTYKDYIEKMRDLTQEYNATQDEEERKRIQARIDLLKESTQKLMEGFTEDNGYALQYLNESFFDAMGIDPNQYTVEEQFEIMNQNIPQMSSNIQDLADKIVGQGGLLNATADAIEEINNATKEYDENVRDILETAGTSLPIITQVVDATGNALDRNIAQAQELITANDELMESVAAQVAAIQKLMDYLDKYLEKVINVQQLISNLREAYNTNQILNGSKLTADEIGAEQWGLDTTAGMEYSGNPATDAKIVKSQIDALMSEYEKFLTQMTIATFDTGGATGTWADASGRLAFLHEKELVLNQEDTVNILKAVESVRAMTSALNGMSLNELSSIIGQSIGFTSGIDNNSTLDQNVHIEANFPNVREHTEIEQAFENLVNMASMHASGYRD